MSPLAARRNSSHFAGSAPSSSFVRCQMSASDAFAKYDQDAKDDDQRQYGVWGTDGIRQRSSSFAAMEQDWEAAVFKVWQEHGVGEVMTQRLLILGAEWQKTKVSQLYRDPAAVRYVIQSLHLLLPGCNPPDLLHTCPELMLDLCVNQRTVATRVVALRGGLESVPGLTVARAVGKLPGLLTRDPGDLSDLLTQNVNVVIDNVGWLLDPAGVAVVLETSPEILTCADAAFANYKSVSYQKLNGTKGWSAALHPNWECFENESEEVFRFRDTGWEEAGKEHETRGKEEKREHAMDGASERKNAADKRKKEHRLPWPTCYNTLGEDARFCATRLSADYASQIVTPFLRRAALVDSQS